MDETAQQESKRILADFMSLNSSSSSLDASFDDREQLAELHKQIEVKKAYRDDLRRLNFGLYALKRGMACVGNEDFEQKLVNENHNTIEQMVEKHWEVTYVLKSISSPPAPLSDSRQVLLDQEEMHKLQTVSRLQEQLRAKLASTRIVKQWDREKSTLSMEQKELSKLEQVDGEITLKRKQMLDRKYSELANVLIRIGETVERAEELRMKLTEMTKNQRNDLHDDQSSESDLRSYDGKRDGSANGTESSKGAGDSDPMFESIDWNSTSVDFQLDLSFKNPNDYPDLLAHLCSINSKKMEMATRSKLMIPVKGTEKNNRSKGSEHKRSIKNGPHPVESSPSSVEQSTKEASPSKKSKMAACNEKVTQQRRADVENVELTEKSKHQLAMPTAPPVKKASGMNPTHGANARPLRKMAPSGTPRKNHPNESNSAPPRSGSCGKLMGAIGTLRKNHPNESDSVQPTTPRSGSSLKSVEAKGNASKQEQQTSRQRSPASREKQEKKQQPRVEQQQPAGSNRPPTRNPAKVEKVKQTIPEPMELDSDAEEMIEPSSSHNSLDFGVQSSDSELDLELDADGTGGNGEDDDLDFLCDSPGRVTRSKANKRKNTADAENSGDDNTFDFGFGESNSSECLDGGLDDLF